MLHPRIMLTVCGMFMLNAALLAQDVKSTKTYQRIKGNLDAVPAIDTHEHLRAFDRLSTRVETVDGQAMNLFSIWTGSYFPWINPLTPWPAGAQFDVWWESAQHDFENARATSFYRSMLPAFKDLYGVDFDTITSDQARHLNAQITENYQHDEWLHDVITNKANIELMLVDKYWNRLNFDREYKFSAPVLNVTEIIQGSHAEVFKSDNDSPFAFAANRNMTIDSLDEYLAVVETIFQTAVAADAICLKSTQAYQRSLTYEQVSKERADEVFGKPPVAMSRSEQRDFEDFMFWHICQLSAKYELPFQVHTGQARVQGSNPILLVDVIESNPQTKFILFHGGYPWVGETAVIAMRHKNVWIDSCWLPTLSYTTAKRAYGEWLEAVPSDRILWGADTVHAEGIYAMTEFTRRCVAEALAEKVVRGELLEVHANRIGRQIMRDNALKLFPKLNRMLWKTPEAQRRGT
ncbi:MAG: amidohydrolase [Pirellulaceae bacterium]|nr:amidohydrolase [Pirellulaceae bacterium]